MDQSDLHSFSVLDNLPLPINHLIYLSASKLGSGTELIVITET